MKKVDLHIHTVATVSDHYFEFSMDTLQSYVECKELDAIAVTNHNLFDRKQYEEICEKISVPVFPGIEIDVEEGQLLLITSPDDLDDFEPRYREKIQRILLGYQKMICWNIFQTSESIY